MSEQQPLLQDEPTAPSYDNDLENGESASKETLTWREWIAEKLESPRLHKIVIALIVIDAVCVLADLSYTFLSDQCSGDPEENPLWLEILSHISLVITTFFLVEIPFALYAFGPGFYNPFGGWLHSSLHLFDAVVIVTTFVLEVVLRGKERELASLLIVLRLWRLIKLVGGVAVGAGELSEETQKALRETERDLQQSKDALQRAHSEIENLKSRLYNA